MAITLGDAVVFLTANSDALQSTLGSAGKTVTGWATSIGSNVALLAGGAVIGGATAAAGAIAGIGAASVNLSSQTRQAQKDMQAELGVTAEEAERLGEVAKKVWGNNFTDNVEEAGAVVAETRKQLGDLADDELQKAAENAVAFSDVFQEEYPRSLNAAKVLMEQFDLTQQEAFDFMAKGFQDGLNSSGDFLDSISEYGNLFGGAGADAGQFFSLLESGMQGGVLGTDKAADAFKEFQIRFLEGTDDSKEAIAELTGDSWEMFIDEIKAGDNTVAGTFGTLQRLLNEVEDPIERNRLGVALMGTQFEDLGADAFSAINLTSTSLDEMAGSADLLNKKYENWGSFFTGLWRESLVAISPVTDKLLEMANGIMPILRAGFDAALPTIQGFIDSFLGYIDRVSERVGFMAEVFQNRGFVAFFSVFEDGTSYFGKFLETLGMSESMATVVNEAMNTIVGFIAGTVLPAFQLWVDYVVSQGLPMLIQFSSIILSQLIPGLSQLVQWGMQIASVVWPLLSAAFQFLANNANIILPILGAVGVAIFAMTSPISAIIAAVALFATAWANNWGNIQGITQQVLDFIYPYFERIKSTLIEFYEGVLPALQEAWTALTTAWTETIMPALAELWAALTELFGTIMGGTGSTDIFSVAMGILKIALFEVRLVVELLTPLIQLIAAAFQFTTGIIRTFVNSLNTSIRAFQTIYNWLGNLITKVYEFAASLASIGENTPEWLVPGSPTPFEMGLRGIGKALDNMPEFNVTPNMNPGLLAAAGGGGTENITFAPGSVVVNAQGQDPATTGDKTQDSILSAMRQKGVRT